MIRKSKKQKEKVERKKSAQKTIPYIRHFDDGIIEIQKDVYSKSFLLKDINYQTAHTEDQEGIFLKYCEFLNGFNSDVALELSINNKSINKESFQNEILLSKKEDNLDVYRDEYNKMLNDKMSKGKNNIRKEKYVTLTVEEEDLTQARESLIRLEAEATGMIKKTGSGLTPIAIDNRMEILHDIYRNGKEGEFGVNPYQISKRRGIDYKDLIAADGMEFKRDHFVLGDKYAQVLFLKDFPSFLTDRILNDLTDFRFNVLLSLNIKTFEPEQALKLVNKQLTGMESNKMQYQKKAMQQGFIEAFIPYNLRNALSEAQELLDDIISKDQKLFLVSATILHIAGTKEELEKQHKLISSAARKNMCQVGVLNYQQEIALANVLPLGHNSLEIDRCLTTESTAIFMPFTVQELVEKGGIWYGLNKVSSNLIMFNRKNLKAPNGFFVGTPGSGKSFLAKEEMVSVLLNTDDDIIIIDPEREYTKVVENFGGEVIHISPASQNYINPLDISLEYGDDEDPLLLKYDFILSLFEVLIGGRQGLAPTQKSIIDRCMRLTYIELIKHDYDKAFTPTLKDFYEIMKNEQGEEAQLMASSLELYATGTLQVFSHKTNLDTNNRLMCYDTKDLGKQLKSMGMLIVLDAIWNRVSINREKGIRTWLYVDEMYIFFSSPYLASFFDEVYRRFRKWGGIPTGITQNIKPMLEYDTARTMLSNSDFIVMLNQSPVDRQALAELLKISDSQLAYVTNSEPGEGLMYTGGTIIPFINEFPQNTQLYRMMSTKVEEINADKLGKKTWTV